MLLNRYRKNSRKKRKRQKNIFLKTEAQRLESRVKTTIYLCRFHSSNLYNLAHKMLHMTRMDLIEIQDIHKAVTASTNKPTTIILISSGSFNVFKIFDIKSKFAWIFFYKPIHLRSITSLTIIDFYSFHSTVFPCDCYFRYVSTILELVRPLSGIPYRCWE